jgi:acetyltransferase-like isoleucine patch superfamily enzyme
MSLKSILKKSSYIERFFRSYYNFRQISKDKYKSVNWFKTIYLNFKTQKFNDALKLPIFVYGKVTIVSLRGNIIIEAPIKQAMIKLGKNTDMFSASKGSALININGSLVFKGNFSISVDYLLDINGYCEFDPFCGIGNSVKIRCWESIKIGKRCRIGLESQIFDTNFHFTKEVNTGRIYPITKPIIVGNYCWIGNRTTIMKGTVLPDHTIIAGNSLCNKDFSAKEVKFPFIAGIPAKIVSSGLVRIFNTQEEKKILSFFRNNPTANYYQGQPGLGDDTF